MNFPLPPSNSSVLDRVKLFLPQIQQANQELDEKIKKDGIKSVQIDGLLDPSKLQQENKKSKGIVEIGDKNSDEIVAAENDSDEEIDASSDGRVVKLEFALGDFDDTPIATMEKQKEEEDANEADEASQVASASKAAVESNGH